MNAHLQRLLARVAPSPAGLGLAAQPINPVASPLADNDQRIGLPEFSGLTVPAESDTGTAETEPAPFPASAESPTEAQAAAPVPNATPTKPATPLSLPARPAEPAPPAAQEPIAAIPPVEPSPLQVAELPAAAGEIALPAGQAAPHWQPPFAIEAEDFEPAPARRADPVDEEVPAAQEIRPAEPAPAKRRDGEIAGPSVSETGEPVSERADGYHQLTEAQPEAPRPAPAMPSTAYPAPAAQMPAAADVADETPEQPRQVVIEEVVIDIVPPPAPRAAPAALQGSERGGARPMPLSAEAASIIGPLPVSRRQPTLLGMRRR